MQRMTRARASASSPASPGQLSDPSAQATMRYPRQTSFYRSFIQSGDQSASIQAALYSSHEQLAGDNDNEMSTSNDNNLNTSAEDDQDGVIRTGRPRMSNSETSDTGLILDAELPDVVPVPRSRPFGRRASSRHLLSGSITGGGSSSSSAAAAAAAVAARAAVSPRASLTRGGSVSHNSGSIDNSMNSSMMNIHKMSSSPPLAATTTHVVVADSPTSSSPPSRNNSGNSGSALNVSTTATTPPPSRTMASSSSLSTSRRSVVIQPPPDFSEEKEEIVSSLATTTEMPRIPKPRCSNFHRQQSWYREALAQGTSVQDLDAMLGVFEENDDPSENGASGPTMDHILENDNNNNNHDDNDDDDELLEQIRILAQLDARKRAKENLGYDPTQVKVAKSNTGTSAATATTTNKETSLSATGHVGAASVPIPPLVAPQPVSFLQQKQRIEPYVPFPVFADTLTRNKRLARQPELQMGTVASTNISNNYNASTTNFSQSTSNLVLTQQQQQLLQGQIVVSCLGCRLPLAVSSWASLVSCPECSCISPASSTRR